MLKVIYKWNKLEMAERSAALALYLLLSIVPFLSLLVALGSSFLSSPQIYQEIMTFLNAIDSQFLASAVKELLEFVRPINRSDIFILLFSLAVMLYGTSGVFNSLQQWFFQIFDMAGHTLPKKRNLVVIIERYVVSVALVLLTIIFVVALLVVGPLLSALGKDIVSNSIIAPVVNIIFSFQVVAIIVVGLIMAGLFRVLSHNILSWPEALFGGVITSFVNAIAAILLSGYFSFSVSGSAFSLATILTILVTWLLAVSSSIILGMVAATYRYNPS